MGKYLLGEFEHLVLLAAIELGSEAYGVSIARALSTYTGREVSQAATYLTLKRLEEKGWLEARRGAASTARGGRPKRTYSVTEDGLAKVRASREVLVRMWAGIQEQLR